jgi:hypothetical protein
LAFSRWLAPWCCVKGQHRRSLQGRFRSLKTPIEYHTYERVNNHVMFCKRRLRALDPVLHKFSTGVILHNMITHHKRLALDAWGSVEEWEAVRVADARRRVRGCLTCMRRGWTGAVPMMKTKKMTRTTSGRSGSTGVRYRASLTMLLCNHLSPPVENRRKGSLNSAVLLLKITRGCASTASCATRVQGPRLCHSTDE